MKKQEIPPDTKRRRKESVSFDSDVASARVNVADATLSSPEINFDTVTYCNLADWSYVKKFIGTSSNGVAS
ncbi:MAG: hypothetical protein EZS28_008141 [Streblomastix strix]|uniref:Uncharacterized protein n=1 Tax=Streblomastix strix TaxID=222440 RepID=A0A5J4WQA9_9EUKA|nr:MAG: hypothetical protein EZS28_008141 [Streblomastix strix]